jgi:hypothetical protein
MLRPCLAIALSQAFSALAPAADGNRLAYLDGPFDPYYPHRDFPKLITPQWVGEEGVECVVTLAIDDMRESAKYEAFLRPILDRLKQIDGRAPVSIMTNTVEPGDPHLQKWLKEGLSIEAHTIDHPCPLLSKGDFSAAKSTYDRCVDLMASIPGNKPVAYRMPCCDSRNTNSPRFYAEIFNSTTETAWDSTGNAPAGGGPMPFAPANRRSTPPAPAAAHFTPPRMSGTGRCPGWNGRPACGSSRGAPTGAASPPVNRRSIAALNPAFCWPRGQGSAFTRRWRAAAWTCAAVDSAVARCLCGLC